MDEFQSKAFEIDGEIEPDDSEPLTGEEYLKRVKWQANRCPPVVVATNIDYSKLMVKSPSKNYFTLPPSITRCKKELLPTDQWEKEFLNNFSEFRQRLRYLKENRNGGGLNIQLPHLNDKKYWYIFCFGNSAGKSDTDSETSDDYDGSSDVDSSNDNNDGENDQEMNYDANENQENEDDENDQEMGDSSNDNKKEPTTTTTTTTATATNNIRESNKPTIEILCKLDHVLTVKLVNYHIEWLETRKFTQERSYWLYMLLSILEKPIDPDTSSNLRSCLRRLSLFRSKIEDSNDPDLPSINILFTIISKYFDQLEPNQVLSL